MADSIDKNVAAGLDSPARVVGLTGLVPLQIQTQPPVSLAPAPGTLCIWIDLPPGVALDPGWPVAYRIFGGEAGLEFACPGQIVELAEPKFPIELRWTPRVFPTAPPRGELSLDFSFRYRRGGEFGIQDLQWRQPVVWGKRGGRKIELRAGLPA